MLKLDEITIDVNVKVTNQDELNRLIEKAQMFSEKLQKTIEQIQNLEIRVQVG